MCRHVRTKERKEMYRIIEMTTHAMQRALERGIEKVDVERVINLPIETIYSKHEQNYKSYGLVNNPYTKEERHLIVIHTILNKDVKIISVMWGARGGLKRHGFRNL